MRLNLIRILEKIKSIEVKVLNSRILIKEKPRVGRPSKQIKLPKYLDLSEQNLEAMGIFLAEGTIVKGYNRIEIGNSEPALLEKFLELLENLGITRNDVKVKINIFYEDACSTKETEIKKFWADKLKISIANFQKITWYHKKGKKKTSPYGVAQLRVYNKLLTKLFLLILHKIIKIVLKRSNLAVPFLRGIFSGEGCVERRGKSIHAIIVSCVKYKSLIKKLLEKIDITTGKYNPRARGFPIRGIENFKKIYELELFRIHPIKNQNFIEGLKNHRYFYKIFPTQCESPKSALSSDRGLQLALVKPEFHEAGLGFMDRSP